MILLPLKQVRFANVKLWPERRCIGEYNAAELSPQSSCLENANTFINASGT